jgi:hypothetical protein
MKQNRRNTSKSLGFIDKKTSPKQGRLGGVYTIQLVTPSVVPIAVKMAITV